MFIPARMKRGDEIVKTRDMHRTKERKYRRLQACFGCRVFVFCSQARETRSLVFSVLSQS